LEYIRKKNGSANLRPIINEHEGVNGQKAKQDE
jgi:hypothetical protein